MQELAATGGSDEFVHCWVKKTGHDKERSLNVSRCLIALIASACI